MSLPAASSAVRSGAFESPADLMRRQFSARATMMSGAGGQPGTHEKGQTGLVKDSEATGMGDLVSQLQVQSHPTGTSSADRTGTAATVAGDKLKSAFTSLVTSAVESASAALPGALHPRGGCPFMSSVFGYPMPDVTHTLKIAGHPVISDVAAIEKQQTFNRSKVVERAVHACGSGAFGYFVSTRDCSQWTKAALFQGVGTTTPVAARFSTTTFGREFPDEARNPRGLAFKFYTTEGNYDMMCINFPSFFVRDGALGPDAIRSQQRSPANFQVNFDAMFDFMSLVPESMLANLWFWSDHGTPQGWMHMDGYPIHAFKWVNAAGQASYVKYRLVSAQGIKNLSQAEAQRVSGIDPDFSKREMWQHIHQGGTAEWIVNAQIIPAERIGEVPNAFDASKPWPEAQYPLVEIGRIVMDKNPENYHRDVEQIAFSPGRLVPGIEPSPDPLLQWRTWLLVDTQLYRLGVNYHQIPVNSPWNTHSYHPVSRDGVMRVDANGGHEPHYYPNSHHQMSATATGSSLHAPGTLAPMPDVSANWQPMSLPNATLDRALNATTEGDPEGDYLAAREFYTTVLNDADRAALHQNIAYSLRTVSRKEVWARWLLACHRTHSDLAAGVLAAAEEECARAGGKTLLTRDELQKCAQALENKPLVDVRNAYKPTPLPINV